MKKIILLLLILISVNGCNKKAEGKRTAAVYKSDVKCYDDVCVGQRWIWKSDNPFSKTPFACYEILDIKDDYVKYINVEYIGVYDKGYTSDRINFFKLWSIPSDDKCN